MSRFGNVRCVKPAGPLVTSLLYETLPRSVPALKWGQEHEGIAREEYCKTTQRKVASRGLVLHECGYLGCSSDGIVFDGKEQGLLEIKCPFSARKMNVPDACLSVEGFCCALSHEVEPSLRRNHNYYFQV